MSCPDGSGKKFAKHVPRLAASQSFSEGEIQLMDFITSALLRGGTAQMAVRHKEFSSLTRKVQSMKGRIADMKAEREQFRRQEQEENAGGGDEGGGAATG